MSIVRDLETLMPDEKPLFAPPELMVAVREVVDKWGFDLHLSKEKVVPFVQVNPYPNKWTPEGVPRWIARCPECPGYEGVPEEGLFLCGSCGAQAEVDRDGI